MIEYIIGLATALLFVAVGLPSIINFLVGRKEPRYSRVYYIGKPVEPKERYEDTIEVHLP